MTSTFQIAFKTRMYIDRRSEEEESSSKLQGSIWWITNQKDENVDRWKSSKEKENCVFCNGSDDLHECKAYKDMVVKERSKFLTKRKFCYGCYEEISSTHTDRNCPKRRKCKICLGKHPAGLHRFKFSSKKADGNKSSTDDDKTVKSNCEYVGDSHKNYTGDLTVLSMCVVPVRIQHEKSNKAVISFAMLDTCSQQTFLTNQLMKDLGIEGTRT